MFNVNCFICSRVSHISEIPYGKKLIDVDISYKSLMNVNSSLYSSAATCSDECEQQIRNRILQHEMTNYLDLEYKYNGDIEKLHEYVKKWEQDKTRVPTTGRKIAIKHRKIYKSCMDMYELKKEKIRRHNYWISQQKRIKESGEYEKIQKKNKEFKEYERIILEQMEKNRNLLMIYIQTDEYEKKRQEKKREEEQEGEKNRKICKVRESKSRLEKIKNLPFMTSKEHNKYRCKKCISICSQYSVTESYDGCCHSFACSCSYSDRTEHYFSCKQCDWKEVDCGYTYEELSSIWKTSKLLDEEKSY